MVKVIQYVCTTIILHNFCIRTPYQNDWITESRDSDSDSKLGCDDGLNLTINLDYDNSTCRDSFHNYLCSQFLSYKNSY
jgi:hypothetical protein